MLALNHRQLSSHPPGARTFPFVTKVCSVNRIMSCAHKALVKENIHSPNTDCPSDLPRQAEGNIGHQLPPLDDRRADGSFQDTTLSGDERPPRKPVMPRLGSSRPMWMHAGPQWRSLQ